MKAFHGWEPLEPIRTKPLTPMQAAFMLNPPMLTIKPNYALLFASCDMSMSDSKPKSFIIPFNCRL